MSGPVVLSGGGLWIEFVWQRDRWGHRVGLSGADETATGAGRRRPDAPPVVGLSEADSPVPPVVGLYEADTSAPSSQQTQQFGPAVTWLLESIEGTPDDDWPPSPALQELHLEERPDGRRLALLVGMAGTSHWSLSVELDPVQRRALFDVACRVKRPPGKLGSAYRQLTGAVTPTNIASASEASQLAHRRIEADVDRIAVPATVRWRYAISAAETGGKPGLMIEPDGDGAA